MFDLQFNSLEHSNNERLASPKKRGDANLDNVLDYRTLLGKSQWRNLHPTIQKRFLEKACDKTTYRGVMSEIVLSGFGKLFAQLCRLIGTPLALYEGKNVPMTVNVYPDEKWGGMTWDRFYHYQHKPENRIRSTKCLLPQEGLVEMIGCGFGMQLKVSQQNGAIKFESDGYFVQLRNFKLKIPDIFAPGKTTVTQTAISDKKFEFKLIVEHRLLGLVYKQVGIFSAAE